MMKRNLDVWYSLEYPQVKNRNRPHGRLDRYRSRRVNNGLSDKTESDSCRLPDGRYGKCHVLTTRFPAKNKKKRDAGYPGLAPDVLWLEILQTLRFYREGEACSIKGFFCITG